jgi:cell division protein FtsL
MSDELANEWAAKNFRGIINTLDNQQADIQEMKENMMKLNNFIAQQTQEINALKNRINILQHGQVLGALN